MAITTRIIEYRVGGQLYDGFMAFDDEATGARPGVLVCHAWSGRSEHEETAARRIAELGYVGFAGDVYGVGNRGETIEECQALMTPLAEDRAELRTRLKAALGQMAHQPEVDTGKTAVSGYCFGGLCALDMARINAPVLGVAAFHSVFGVTGEDGEDIGPKVLAMQGYEDPMADPDAQRAFADEMTERRADWQLHLYGGVKHAFTNQGADNSELGLKYNVAADARSWATFEAYLAELFG